VSRSKKTAKAKHYAFLEFQHPDVAKIAADTMDGYFLFKQVGFLCWRVGARPRGGVRPGGGGGAKANARALEGGRGGGAKGSPLRGGGYGQGLCAVCLVKISWGRGCSRSCGRLNGGGLRDGARRAWCMA
jgi:hypothetical protein